MYNQLYINYDQPKQSCNAYQWGMIVIITMTMGSSTLEDGVSLPSIM